MFMPSNGNIRGRRVNQADTFGVFHNLPFDEYQQIPALNQSKIKQIIPNGYTQVKTYINSQALKFGNAGHCMLLEPEKFENLYLSAPKNLSQRGKKGKNSWREFCELHSGKIVLSFSDWARLQKIKKCFQIHPQVQQLFSNGNSEVSLHWKDSEYGLNCKARLDWLDSDSRKIVDLKFTKNIIKAASIKPIKNEFSLQAGWYTRGIYQLTNKTTDFFFIFIEKFAPHSIKIVKVCNEDFIKGQDQIEQGIKNINQTKTI